MKAKRPAVSPEERELFVSAMADVSPLGARDRLPKPPPPKRPVAVAVLPPRAALAAELDRGRYAARSPGVSHAQIAELRAGKVHVDATLDLHGHTIEPAISALRAFLIESHRLARRCVLIVHGRGTHSDVGAPLREAVLSDLLGEASGLVHAFSSAAAAAGGDGATYVMLRGRT